MRRRSQSSSPIVPVVLSVGVLAIMGFIGLQFRAHQEEDRSLFDVKEDTGPKTWTSAQLEPIARLDAVAEKRYRDYVRNVYRADDTPRGRKLRLENSHAMSEMADYLLTNIFRNCEGADPDMAKFVVEAVLADWLEDTESELALAGVRRGGGFAVANAGESRQGSSPREDGVRTAIQRADRLLDRNARKEIRLLFEGLRVPSDYADRARWLTIELEALRSDILQGVNLNAFAYRVVRCEELFIFFHQWADEAEHSKRSFSWLQSNLDEMRSLRDRWRAWSSGQVKGLTKEKVEAELTELARNLESADVIFALK